MSDERRSLPPGYFDSIYAESVDPWEFETRPYEAAKYQATLDALPRERYASALEVGCSIGVFTQRLAERCESLLAVDVSDRALERARERCRGLDHVRFTRMQIPVEFPDRRFDLIVVSEVGYYWSRDDLLQARGLMIANLIPGGHLLLIHWTPAIDDALLTGDEVHGIFAMAESELAHAGGSRAGTYRVDLFEKREPGSLTS